METTVSNELPQPARPGDLEAVLALLEAENLPASGVEHHFGNFLVVRQRDRVIGAVGFEAYGTDALLRSLVVEPASRGRGLGRLLLDHVRGAAYARGVRTVYLLTTTIEPMLGPLGFERCDRAIVPAAIASTGEFRSLCPSSAVCMRQRLASR